MDRINFKTQLVGIFVYAFIWYYAPIIIPGVKQSFGIIMHMANKDP